MGIANLVARVEINMGHLGDEDGRGGGCMVHFALVEPNPENTVYMAASLQHHDGQIFLNSKTTTLFRKSSYTGP